jgi:F420-non-reducing hydrogenase small subunit
MGKLRVGIYWGAACGGCDASLLEINEQILQVAEAAEIVLWPCAADLKYADLKNYPDGWIDLTLFNGAIRTEENLELAKLIRAKSRLLAAYGSCAHTGGLIGLANLSTREQIFETVYGGEDLWPLVSSTIHGEILELTPMLDQIQSLHQVVPIDYTIPGCPPPRVVLTEFFDSLLAGRMPPVGHVFASEKNLCEECSREREHRPISKIYRPHQIEADPELCLLDQGIICLGPATRGGCGAVCPAANMPCSGCAGATQSLIDQGAGILNTVASLVGVEDEGEPYIEVEDEILNQIKDAVGTFYRFNFAVSNLGTIHNGK